MKKFSFLFIFLITAIYSNDQNFIFLGDTYYRQQNYSLSLLFYETYLLNSELRKAEVASKTILNYIRLKENHNSFSDIHLKDLLSYPVNDFSYNYISIYGAFRLGMMSFSFPHMKRILDSPISEEKKEYAKLIFGSLYLEENYEDAKKYYEKLFIEAQNEEVKKISSQILEEIKKFEENFSYKKPWLAATLSAIFPGMGYFYTNHKMDGFISFFWNTTFLGAGAYMYDLEKKLNRPHYISSGFILTGLIFYISNIIGSYTSATRYNNYQIRIFHQKLRSLYFNTDFVERTSGIEFHIKF